MLGFLKGNSEDSFNKDILKEPLDSSKVQSQIDSGIDINSVDQKGRTILFTLCNKRKIEAIKLLLKNGIDINHEDNMGKTVLNEAVSKSDSMMVRFLLDNGASINHKNSDNRTLLQDAALEGNYRIFKALLPYEPDFNLTDNYRKTVLFDAVEGNDEKILAEVVKNVDDLNILDDASRTVLFSAVLKKNILLAEILIKAGINVNQVDEDGRNVLFNAVIPGKKNISILRALIKKKIDLNVKDNSNMNVLDLIFQIFKYQKVSPKELPSEFTHIDYEDNYLQVITLLIASGLDVNTPDKNGDSVLRKLVKQKNYDGIAFLIKCGVDINAKDLEGKTVLHHELLKGNENLKMIDFLIKNGASVEIEDNFGKAPYEYLIDIILMQRNEKRQDVHNFIHYIEDENYEILFKKFLTYKPDLEKTKENGRNLLFDVIRHNDFELLKILFAYGMDPNTVGDDGKTPLAVIIEEGMQLKDILLRDKFLERLVFLLKFRVNVDIQDNDGRTVIHKAVIANDVIVLEKLLTKKADLNIKDRQGRTALHHVQRHGNYKIARWLIAAGADMNLPDASGFTLLNYAAIFGHVKLVAALVASGVLMYNKNKKNLKVAQFLRTKITNLNKLSNASVSDEKMKRALKEVAINTKNEIYEALNIKDTNEQ